MKANYLQMYLHRLKFKDWEFEVNSELTRKTYAKVIAGFSDGCDCNYCLNYRNQRDKIFPKEIEVLFDHLGIDFHKESECISSFEISDLDINADKLYGYGGWFHFAGNIISGKECFSKELNTFKLTPITENFSIGFVKDRALNFFEDDISLVQVEYGVEIPWIVENIEE